MTTRLTAVAAVLGVMLGTASPFTYAEFPTNVQFSSAGNGTYNVTNINEFDWQSSGDLVVVNALPTTATAGGATVSTFLAWATGAVVGDTVIVNVHGHARLNAMLDSNGGNVAPPTLSKDGATCTAGTGCYEITAAFSGEETGTLIAPGIIQFTSLTGSFRFYFDDTPDSQVGNTDSTPPGPVNNNFIDGVPFLTGTLVGVSGLFMQGVGGQNLLRSVVDTYDANYIQTDPAATSVRLSGATFDTLITLPGTFDAFVPDGDPIGLSSYIVQAADLVLKADANTEFSAIEENVLEGCRMTGGGVDGKGEITLTRLATATGTGGNRYTFGGQVGAPTAAQPQPFGEWTHHQQKGPAGDFMFHLGTASAPEQTRILTVECKDPINCNPARPAPFKQLDFTALGVFKSIHSGPLKNKPGVVPGAGGSVHFVRVHVEDLGEPGAGGKQVTNPICESIHQIGANVGDPNTSEDAALVCTNCADVYTIEIHLTANPTSDVIYSVSGFIDGGNLQLHPPIQ